MRGLGRIYKRGPVWWVSYYHRGKRFRESSRSESESQAKRLLKKRLGEIHSGRFIGPIEEQLTFEAMVTDLENDYSVNNRRSLATVRFHIAHLKQFFGFDRAVDITPDRVKAYQVQRLSEGASRATVNREVACLGRMLTLAVNTGKLLRRPRLQLLDGERVRQGFLEHGDFIALLGELPSHLQPIVGFLYQSGWRKGEAAKLEWRDVDWESQTLRLRMENSKNKEARILPLTGRLLEIMQERAKERRLDCPYVFHHKGQRVGDFRKAWKAACVASGLGRVEKDPTTKKKIYHGTVIVHDLRRCAARNLSRAGIQETVAMEMTGHKTRSMYRRYRIVDERDLREAADRLQVHLDAQPKTRGVEQLRPR